MSKPSPELLRRVAEIDGCHGQWLVCYNDPYSRSERLGELVHTTDGYVRFRTPEEALTFCAENRWQGYTLAFSHDLTNDDSWYGYEPDSIYIANAKAFRERFRRELELGQVDGDGIAVDIRYITNDMIETFQALENYPLICEDTHSQVQMEKQDEAWESDIREEWRAKVAHLLDDYAPEDSMDWGEEQAERLTDDQLSELFHDCDGYNYWYEESGSMWADVDRPAEKLPSYISVIGDYLGLKLLPPDQHWRREPYPWPGADPSPLEPQLPVS